LTGPSPEPNTGGRLKQACREMFAAHEVEAFGERFHVPAAREYSCLFAWDSGYHALALRHLDPALARRELGALFRANTCEDGLLAHERPLPGSRRAPPWSPTGWGPSTDPTVAAG